MKILFYSHSSTQYGATSSMVNLIMGIKSLYPEVQSYVILPKKGPLEDYLQEKEIRFSVIPNSSWYYSSELSDKKKKQNIILWKLWFLKNKWEKRYRNQKNIIKHLQFVRTFQPDFIYVNSSLAPMGTYVASNLDIPLIWHHRETVNEDAYKFFLEYPKLFRKMFKRADLHIYTSNFLQKFYDNYETKNRRLVVFNGVDFRSSGKKKTMSKDFEFIKFGLVGRINSQKGQDEVIKLFHQMKKEKGEKFRDELHIIGGGRKEYIDEIGCNDPENNIFFHGFLSKNNIFEKFDFLIMNSTNEAFGRVVAEANMHGIPVIAKKSGAFPEIIKKGINGFLYEDLHQLQEILQKLIGNMTLAKYKNLSEGSRIEFENNFSIEDYTKRIITKIKEI